MTIRVGINGFGRIGRNFWRAVHAAQEQSYRDRRARTTSTDPATLPTCSSTTPCSASWPWT